MKSTRGHLALCALALLHWSARAQAIEELGGASTKKSHSASSEERANEVAELQVAGWKHKIWTLYPVEKLRAEQSLNAASKEGPFKIDAAPGECEPFIVVLRSEVPLREVQVRVSGLHDDAGHDIETPPEIQRVGYVYINEPSGTRMKAVMPYETGTGEYPDPLLKGHGEARPNRNLQFLITLKIPHGAVPGSYHGEIEIEFRRESWWPAAEPHQDRIPIHLRVRSFTLPHRSPLMNTSVVSTQRLPEWLHRPDVMRDLSRDLHDHYQTQDPLPSPAIRLNKSGELTVDSVQWEKAVEDLFESGKTGHVFLPTWSSTPSGHMQGLYFLWHFPAVIQQRWFGAKICNEEGELEHEFKSRYGTYLRHMHSLLTRRGWLDRVFLSTMDEPYTYHTGDRARDTPENNYRVIANFVQWVRKEAPGLKTFATANPHPSLHGLIDHWCLRNLDSAADAAQRAQQFGEILTFCDNYRTFIDYPAVSARSLGWLAWKIGARGWLTYETTGSFTESLEGQAFVYPQFGGSTVWGMGHMFYPDVRGKGSIAPSLRWQLMREGAEDYLYLYLLRQRIEAGDSTDTEALKLARAFLETAASKVVGGSGDAETTAEQRQPNAQRNLVPHRLRLEAADLLERLMR